MMHDRATPRRWFARILSLGLTLAPGPWLVASVVHAQTVTYTYDTCTNGVGYLCGGSDSTGSSVMTYDGRGNLTSAAVTLTTGAPCPTATPCTVARTYDSQNRLVRLTYPGGEQVLHFYNAQGRLDRVCRTTDGSTCASGGDYVGNLNYNALGQVTTRVLGSGTIYTTTYEYYRSGATTPCNSAAVGQRDTFRLCTITTSGLQQLTYTYDPVGNATSITDAIGTHLASQDFGYDPLNRLTSASTKTGATPVYSHSYGYNAIGNLTSAAGQSYTYPLPGYPRPHAATSDGTSTYCYDANGNLEKKLPGTAAPCSTTGAGVRSFTWDAENRLTAITDNTTPVATFRYNGPGQRVQKTAGAATTTYVGALQQIVGSARTNYIFANGQRVAAHDLTANRVSYYLTDQLGSTSVFVDAPNPNQVLAYEPYGTVRAGGTAGVAHKFTGQELDEEVGLYDYGARYYDPSLRRFISADSMGGNPANPQTLNRYAYVLNNPLRYTDPSGHAAEDTGLCFSCLWNDFINWLSPPAPPMANTATMGTIESLSITPLGTLTRSLTLDRETGEQTIGTFGTEGTVTVTVRSDEPEGTTISLYPSILTVQTDKFQAAPYAHPPNVQPLTALSEKVGPDGTVRFEFQIASRRVEPQGFAPLYLFLGLNDFYLSGPRPPGVVESQYPFTPLGIQGCSSNCIYGDTDFSLLK